MPFLLNQQNKHNHYRYGTDLDSTNYSNTNTNTNTDLIYFMCSTSTSSNIDTFDNNQKTANPNGYKFLIMISFQVVKVLVVVHTKSFQKVMQKILYQVA